jgi:diacylglycerol kinase family enzyme
MAKTADALVVINPMAYGVRHPRRIGIKGNLEAMLRRGAKALGKDIDIVYSTMGPEGLELPGVRAEEYPLIGSLSGDGGSGHLLKHLMERELRTPLFCMKGGTGNGYEAILGLPKTIEEQLALGLTGAPRKVDIMRIEGSAKGYAMLFLSFGLCARQDWYLDWVKDNLHIEGRAAHWVAGLGPNFLSYKPIHVDELTIDGKCVLQDQDVAELFLGKGGSPDGIIQILHPGYPLDNGLAKVGVYENRSRLDLLRMLPKVWRRFEPERANFYDASEITVACRQQLQIDGTAIHNSKEKGEYTIKVLQREYTVIMPPSSHK